MATGCVSGRVAAWTIAPSSSSSSSALAQAADAHRLLEDREATGRLVLKPWA